MESNVERNTPNARIVPYGLADEEKGGLSEIGLAAHTIAETAEHDAVEIGLITARKAVDDFGLSRPSVVKMDIEGAELAALDGFSDLIHDVRLLFCEVHPKRLDQMGASGEEVERYLTDAGFNVNGWVIGAIRTFFDVRDPRGNTVPDLTRRSR